MAMGKASHLVKNVQRACGVPWKSPYVVGDIISPYPGMASRQSELLCPQPLMLDISSPRLRRNDGRCHHWLRMCLAQKLMPSSSAKHPTNWPCTDRSITGSKTKHGVAHILTGSMVFLEQPGGVVTINTHVLRRLRAGTLQHTMALMFTKNLTEIYH